MGRVGWIANNKFAAQNGIDPCSDLYSKNPDYRAVEPGLHLGYRKPLQGAGKWVARHYQDGAYKVEVIAVADDFSDSDGIAFLDYRQALKKARERMVARA